MPTFHERATRILREAGQRSHVPELRDLTEFIARGSDHLAAVMTAATLILGLAREEDVEMFWHDVAFARAVLQPAQARQPTKEEPRPGDGAQDSPSQA